MILKLYSALVLKNLYRQVMKEVTQKHQRRVAVNPQRIKNNEKAPSQQMTVKPIACQPKMQPNINPFLQCAQPRHHVEQNRRDQFKENARMRQNDPIPSNRQNQKFNVLLKDHRKSHQSAHEEPMRKTQKKFRAVREERAIKGKTEWVSIDEDGALGCHQHLNSHPTKCFGKIGQSARPKMGETGVRKMSDAELIVQYDKQLSDLAWKQQTQRLNELVKREQSYSRSPHYNDYLSRQTNITWLNRAFVLNWMMLLSSQLHCRREVYATAVSIFDRYLGVGPVVALENLQLLGSTCLFLAEKLEDNSRVSVSNFWEPVSQRHTQDELLELELNVALKLSFRLQAPTINAWANRLCAQWDLYVSNKSDSLCSQIRFKSGSPQVLISLTESYQNFRWMAQYIDFSLLDVQTLQYKNRTIAASFLYLTILLRLEIHTAEEVAANFRSHSQFILSPSPFNEYFSGFLNDSFGFPLADILPTVQYCSIFVVLPLNWQMPQVDREGDLMSFQQYCGIQTFNDQNKRALSQLDRHFW